MKMNGTRYTEVKTVNGIPLKKGAMPIIKKPATVRKHDDYTYEVAYCQGWNNAMKSIFEIEDSKK